MTPRVSKRASVSAHHTRLRRVGLPRRRVRGGPRRTRVMTADGPSRERPDGPGQVLASMPPRSGPGQKKLRPG